MPLINIDYSYSSPNIDLSTCICLGEWRVLGGYQIYIFGHQITYDLQMPSHTQGAVVQLLVS
jgi:hypothetical protein